MSSSGDTNLLSSPYYLWCEDLWVDILKRLPVITLYRLRRVCKSWNSLISSSFFSNQHHSFNINRCINNTSYLSIGRSYSLYTPPQDEDGLAQLPAPKRVPFQPRDSGAVYEVIDVTHGVVCLSPNMWRGDSTVPTILWNPIIHKCTEIPCLTTREQCVVGFGFDPCKNDFKVVRFSARKPRIIFEVFSTREGLWRKVNYSDHVGPFTHYDYRGRSKYSAIHWMIERYTGRSFEEKEKALLVFDCQRKEFKKVDIPGEINEHGWTISPWLFVSNPSGRLSILAITRSMEKGKELEEWVMEEKYGSWKKLRMRDQQDILKTKESRVLQLHVFLHNGVAWLSVYGMIKRSPHLLNGFVFEPSFYLLDVSSYHYVKHDEDGEVYYIKNGRRYDQIYTSHTDTPENQI